MSLHSHQNLVKLREVTTERVGSEDELIHLYNYFTIYFY